MTCSACGSEVNPGARFCSHCGRAVSGQPVVEVYSHLVRPRYGRAIGGVCAGFAQHYGWDVVLVRLLLCAVVLLGFGMPIIAYFIAWIVMPNESYYCAAPPAAATSSQPTI
jgi:phage shock protein C